LGKFKVCSFKNGEIITKDVIKEGLGKEKYNDLICGKVLKSHNNTTTESEIV